MDESLNGQTEPRFHCEPIVRFSTSGLKLAAVEFMAGGPTAATWKARGKLLELDCLAAEAARRLKLPEHVAVHLNLPVGEPTRALDSQRYLSALKILSEERRVVLEIPEYAQAQDFADAFEIARLTGVCLVVDDLAPGNQAWQWVEDNLRQCADAGRAIAYGGKFDWVYFQSSVRDGARWDDFCQHVHRFGDALCSVTIEGIENVRHLLSLGALVRPGITFDVQGFFLNDLFKDRIKRM